MPALQYPLDLRFRLIALAPRIHVTDAAGTERMFIHQKTFALKEDILVYNNSNKNNVIFRIRADRIIDFSATYRFYQGEGEQLLGAVKRKGMRSLWRATYLIDDANGQSTHHIKEDNPWVKIWDGLLPDIISGFFLHPSYTVYRGANREDESSPVMTLQKKSGFFEGRYGIELRVPDLSQNEEIAALLALIMLVQLERRRG
jgi:uncharacterized protein YxjI